MRNIVICQGDENRAKIEQKLTEDIFFANVYKMAEGILRELIDESEEYRKLAEDMNSENARYQRVGSNVIAFCASRGQGKTSAMKSFAKFLSNGYRGAGRNDILEEDILERNEFVVLDSVDPAALDGGESLSRVVISRLFYLLEKKYKESDSRNDQDKNRLLDLFQECYCSIDYLQGKKKGDDWQDDLEKLAALGNSSKLKRSLIELIALFLKVYTEKGGQTNYENPKNRFLIIPIDDVDICVSDIYACCEEIRNYLSLPNVIVLLAADYEQLHRVIYQKYLQINKTLLKYEKDMYVECNRQASGYLLKLLPSNHVIVLPELGTMSESDREDLKLVYNTKNAKGELTDCLAESTMKCRNLREQIAKIIYDRTGIIFWSDEEKGEEFVPQTMRGLTQLVKKIVFRPTIAQQELYNLNSNDNRTEKDKQVENLLSNIQIFKNYFLDSWCMNCMTHAQYTEFKTWIHNIEKRRRNGTFSLNYDQMLCWINALWGGDANAAENRKRDENDSHKDDVPPEKALPHAVRMYLAIFMNEWFAEALRDEQQYAKVVKFIGMERGIRQRLLTNPDENKYKKYTFRIDENSCIWDMLKREFTDFFCQDFDQKKYFDFMIPWYKILKNGYPWSERKVCSEVEDTVSKSLPADSLETDANITIDLRLPLKIIFANSGIYSYVENSAVKNLGNTNETLSSKEPNWKQMVDTFYDSDLKFIGQLDYLELKNIVRLLKDFYLSVENDWASSFAAEDGNQWIYCSEYQEEYSWLLDEEELDKEVQHAFLSCTSSGLIINPKFLVGMPAEFWQDEDKFYTIKFSQEAIESKRKELDQLSERAQQGDKIEDKIYDVLKSIRTEYLKRRRDVNLSPEEKADNEGGEKPKKQSGNSKKMAGTTSAEELLLSGE